MVRDGFLGPPKDTAFEGLRRGLSARSNPTIDDRRAYRLAVALVACQNNDLRVLRRWGAGCAAYGRSALLIGKNERIIEQGRAGGPCSRIRSAKASPVSTASSSRMPTVAQEPHSQEKMWS